MVEQRRSLWNSHNRSFRIASDSIRDEEAMTVSDAKEPFLIHHSPAFPFPSRI